MARPKINENEKLLPVPTRLAPAVVKQIEEIADARKWSIGQTVREMVEEGLSMQPPISKQQGESAQAAA